MVVEAPDVAHMTVGWDQAVARGRQWLVKQVDRTPAFGAGEVDLNWYCKVPWALVASGDRDASLRALGAAYYRFIHPALRPPRETHWTNAVGYALGWLVAAACACEAGEIARNIYARMLEHTCTKTGALQSHPEWFDASIQGAALHATAAMGDIPAVRRIGDVMTRFVDDQPQPDDAIYTHFHPERGYFMDRSRDGAADTSGRYVFRRGAVNQPLATLGFVMQGLIRVGEVTGDARYTVAAGRLLDRVFANHRDDLLAHSQNHKVGHAAMMLWRHTGREELFDIAIAIAGRVAHNIQPDGRALADVFYDDISRQAPYFTVRTTCDSVLWLAAMRDELLAAGHRELTPHGGHP